MGARSTPPPAPSTPASPWPRALLLAVVVVIAYAPVGDAGFIWDDDYYVTDNRTLHDVDGLVAMWTEPRSLPQYYPLVHTTYWLEARLWGLDPEGYHFTNVLLHAASAIVLWRLLVRLRCPGAYLAAMLFAAHPVQVESVAWITERKNVLSGLLFLASLSAWLRFRPLEGRAGDDGGGDRDGEPAPRGRGLGAYALSLVAFVGALLSKTVTCSLPAVALLLVYWKRGRVRTRDVAPLLPFFALGALFAWLTVHLETTHVGAAGADWTLSLGQRFAIAGRALWFYASKLVAPFDLAFIYPRWDLAAGGVWNVVAPLAAAAVPLACWLARARLGRGPLVAVLAFGGMLLPALGFFDVYPMRYSFVADHFQYLPSVALLTLGAAALTTALARRGIGERGLELPLALLAALLLAPLTHAQTRVYRDLPTLWRDTLAKNPDCWLAHNNLATIELQAGRLPNARHHLERALAIDPDDPDSRANLGALHEATGAYDEAIAVYRDVLATHPEHARTSVNLARRLEARGEVEEAAALLERAIEADPMLAQAYNALGLLRGKQGRLDEAIELFTRALELLPSHADAAHNLEFARSMQRGDD